MIQNSFAVTKGLKSGDIIVVPKSRLNIVQHYVVYWGMDINGNHFYLENNYKYGVRYITEADFVASNPFFNKIIPFPGNEYERSAAIERAVSCIGKGYNVAVFNCENYANFVQTGVAHSEQVNKANGIMLIGLLAVIGRLAFSR